MAALAHDAVDFYFDFSSNNTYFAFFMVAALCNRAGARLNLCPLYLGGESVRNAVTLPVPSLACLGATMASVQVDDVEYA